MPSWGSLARAWHPYATPSRSTWMASTTLAARSRRGCKSTNSATYLATLHITEDGGLGLNASIPEQVHNYGHAHDGVLSFLRKGLSISPGASHIDFTALVTGASPPDVHFVEVVNMTLTNTSLVNSSNVNPFIADWAETKATPTPYRTASSLRCAVGRGSPQPSTTPHQH